MKKTVRMAFAAAATVLTLGGSHVLAQDQDPVKVGFVLSLSGPGAVIGLDMQRGAELAIEELGGTIGGRAAEFIFEDDQRKPDVGKQAAERLVQSEKVDVVVGASFSNVMMAIHRPVTRAKTLLLSPNPAPAPLAGEDCSPYYFAVPFQNDQPAEAIGIHLNNIGVKTAFILAPNYQAGRDLLAGFKRHFKGELVGEIYTPLEQTDFSAELTEIRSANPEAVFVFYPGGLGIQFVKQYSQAGLKDSIPLHSAFTVGGATLEAIGEDGLGVTSGSQWAYDLPNEANKAFVAAYRAKYNGIPSEFAAQAYDTIRLIDSAAKAVGGKVEDTDAMAAAIKSANFESVRGSFSFNRNNHPIHNMYLLVVKKNDAGELVASADSLIVKDMPDAYVDACPMGK
ncbi:ABC transporter substrate-binding protein [Limibacillus sp. MBR-115]|jgi:branched-chain amino acid transport system substrate-binding protein|uniref:ABC transporter substrate-binding protein n=1 Tax=Limibacillus sp. MBR-115 TaxID=3156465 RepID=UPI0033992D40